MRCSPDSVPCRLPIARDLRHVFVTTAGCGRAEAMHDRVQGVVVPEEFGGPCRVRTCDDRPMAAMCCWTGRSFRPEGVLRSIGGEQTFSTEKLEANSWVATWHCHAALLRSRAISSSIAAWISAGGPQPRNGLNPCTTACHATRLPIASRANAWVESQRLLGPWRRLLVRPDLLSPIHRRLLWVASRRQESGSGGAG